MSKAQQLTRQHLRGYGLSQYQAIALTKPCLIQGKLGAANLYAIADILQSARAYAKKPGIKTSTRVILSALIQQLETLSHNVVSLPFSRDRSEVKRLVTALIRSKTETNPFKLRAALFKGTSKYV